jgi:hypothetical protein
MRVPVLAILVLTFCIVSLAATTPAGEVGSNPSVQQSGKAYPAASNPDLLVANFEQAVNEMNLDEYAKLLHADFAFIFAPGDRHRVAPDDRWNREDELSSMRSLFSGEPGTSRFGREMPGVEGIKFALVAADDWIYGLAESETWTRTYHAFAKVLFRDGTRRLITRQQVLTLTARRNEWDLAPVDFQVLRWEEIGCGSPAECQPRMVKALY